MQVRAKVSLERWRRLHCRANVNDLDSTLSKLGHHDIVRQIQKILNPPAKEIPKVTQRWRKIKHLKFAMGKLMKFKPQGEENSNAAERELAPGQQVDKNSLWYKMRELDKGPSRRGNPTLPKHVLTKK